MDQRGRPQLAIHQIPGDEVSLASIGDRRFVECSENKNRHISGSYYPVLHGTKKQISTFVY
jgi:hypothetical protein